MLKALSENLSGEQLNVIFLDMSDNLKGAYIKFIEQHCSDQAKVALVDLTQGDMLAEKLVTRFADMTAEAIASTTLGKAIIPVLGTISGAIDNAQSAIGGAAWNRLDPATQEKLLELKTRIDSMLGASGTTVRPLPAPIAHNRQSLDAANWSESRIQRELVLRNTQFKAVHEVDSWVKGHNSTVDEYFRTEFPRTHPGVNIEHAKGNYGEMSADLKFTE